jgi:N-acetylglutamate synthase-like GNAT family acetyltransferase
MSLIREYHTGDYDACLAVFDSNVPLYFAAAERTSFANFLARLTCPFFVTEHESRVVGCGGFYLVPADGVAGLVWGMIARDHQRGGVGSALLRERLRRLASEPAIRMIRVNTSQHTAAFFQRFGFQTTLTVENHFADGLHQHQMLLRLP